MTIRNMLMFENHFANMFLLDSEGKDTKNILRRRNPSYILHTHFFL